MIQSCILLYLDPGSGSYLIQAIIAAIVGALFYFKNIWRNIRAFFWKPKNKDAEGEDIAK